MDIVFLVCLSTLPLMGSLWLAARIWGKPAVIKFVREAAWQLGRLAEGLGRRLIGGLRVLIGAHLDEEDAASDIAEEVEERLSYRVNSSVDLLKHQLNGLRHRVENLEKQARMVLPISGDAYDE